MSGVVGTEPEPGSQDHMGLPPLHVQRVISPEKQRGAGPTWTEPEPPREPSRFWDFASFWSRAHLISQVPCFSGMPESDIRLLTSALTDQQYAAPCPRRQPPLRRLLRPP